MTDDPSMILPPDILRVLSQSSSLSHGQRKRRTVRVVQEIPSAQQRVLILQLLFEERTTTSSQKNASSSNEKVEEEKEEPEDTTSCGTAVSHGTPPNGTTTIVGLVDKTQQQPQCYLDVDDDWNAALEAGHQLVVLRIWKGVKRWWNFNHTSSITPTATISETTTTTTVDMEQQQQQQQQCLQNMARQEIWGYRMARQAFHYHHHHRSLPENNLRIPAVLYFSLEHHNNNNNNNNTIHPEPWALLEYVGEQSTLFGGTTARVFDPYWTQSMIPMRTEFGWVEPHPRWGRVPVQHALEYAQTVLQQVILPLHKYYWDGCCHHPDRPIPNHTTTAPTLQNSSGTTTTTTTAVSYADVVANCRQKYTQFLLPQQQLQTSESEAAAINEPESFERATFLQDSVEKLGWAIAYLEHNIATLDELQLLTPPVLCHMDLQPQNVLFAADQPLQNNNDDNNHNPHRNNNSIVVSVLDWEEAAYADPRFELLMLGRKVCANRSQAESIWQMYQTTRRRQWSCTLSQSTLGPLEPWLRLETVHSLTTLLLQAITPVGQGGRSPWETWNDLRGKLEREWQRWKNYDSFEHGGGA